MNTYMNTKQLAQHLSLSVSFLEKLRLAGDGPPFAKLGKKVVYRVHDVEAWIESRVVKSTSESSK